MNVYPVDECKSCKLIYSNFIFVRNIKNYNNLEHILTLQISNILHNSFCDGVVHKFEFNTYS